MRRGADLKNSLVILAVVCGLLPGCSPGVRNIRLMNTQLLRAAQSGNLQGVRQSLNSGAEINAKPSAEGGSALFLACRNGHYDVVRYLLDEGANINTMAGSKGATALYIASANGHARIVRLLLDRGASPYDALFNGWTPMTASAYLGHAETAGVLHDAGVDDDVHVHAALGRLEKIKERVNSDADANLPGPNGLTPLFFAVHNGKTEVMGHLLQQGADPNYQNPGGFSPLHDAAKTQDVAVARMLLKSGADIAIRDKNGLTPLHAAAESGNTAMVDFFLKRGAHIDAAGSKGATPLYLAVINNQFEAARMLIDRGADIEKGVNGWTPLHAAAHTGNIAMAGMLLDHGAAADAAVRDTGELPADIAYATSKMEMLAFLEDGYGRARVRKARQLADSGNAAAARSEISRAVDHYIGKIEAQDRRIAIGSKPPVEPYDMETGLQTSLNDMLGGFALKTRNASLMAQTQVNRMSINAKKAKRPVPGHVRKARAFKSVYEQLKSKYDRMAACLDDQGGSPGCLTKTLK
jgi:ankyrin repeat protein